MCVCVCLCVCVCVCSEDLLKKDMRSALLVHFAFASRLECMQEHAKSACNDTPTAVRALAPVVRPPSCPRASTCSVCSFFLLRRVHGGHDGGFSRVERRGTVFLSFSSFSSLFPLHLCLLSVCPLGLGRWVLPRCLWPPRHPVPRSPLVLPSHSLSLPFSPPQAS